MMTPSRRRFTFSIRVLMLLAVTVAIGLCHFVLPSVHAHRFAKQLRAGTTAYGASQAAVQPVTLWQLVRGRRAVHAKTQLGLGFRRLIFEVSASRTQVLSEEVPVHEWRWGLRLQTSSRAGVGTDWASAYASG